MRLKGKFTQIPDDWWQLVGKHPVVNKDTGEVTKVVNITHWMVGIIAKVDSFNSVKITDDNAYNCKCTASNAYFASLFNMSLSSVKKSLSDLYALGVLKSYEQREGNLTTKRYLYVNHDVLDSLLASEPSTIHDTSPDENCENDEPSSTHGTGVVPHTEPPSTTHGTPEFHTLAPNNKEKENKRKIDNMFCHESSIHSKTPSPPSESQADHLSFKEIDGSLVHPALAGEKFTEEILQKIERGEVDVEALVAIHTAPAEELDLFGWMGE